MITKVKIVKAIVTDKNKDGTPCIAAGKPVRRLGIQTEEFPDQWLTCTLWRVGQKEETLKAGDSPEISIIENRGYRNFTIASKTDKLEDIIQALTVRLERLEVRIDAGDKSAKVPEKRHVDPRIAPGEPTSDEIAF